MRAKITKRLVEDLNPEDKILDVHDTELPGFVLRTMPTGRKSWYLSYRNQLGKRRMYRIGAYPGLMPEGARLLAREAAGKIAARIDPQAEKQAARTAAQSAKVPTLGEFIEHTYAPWVRVEHPRNAKQIGRLTTVFSGWLKKPINTITTVDIDTHRQQRLATRKPATVQRDVAALSSVLTLAKRRKLITEHPVREVAPVRLDRKPKVRFLSEDEEQRLREALAKQDAAARASRRYLRPAVLVAINTGLRRGELLALTWDAVDFKHKTLTVEGGTAKSKQTRHIPLNDEALKVLQRWKANQKSDASDIPTERVFAVEDPKKGWAALLKAARITRFRWHDLRHHFASRLVQRGVPLNTVRQLLGHADLKMTLRYAHLAHDDLAAAVAKLEV